jgi:hypothetical protein
VSETGPRQSRAREPVPDAPGYDLKPDPLATRSAADLVAALAGYREWAGNPSYRGMAHACRQRASAATLQRVLHEDAMPKLEHVIAVIEGCGGSTADQERFMLAWRKIALGAHPDAEVIQLRAPPSPRL